MPACVEFMGLLLKNPILTAAGPWARDGASIQRCVDAGAAAVITETITLEANPVLRPRLYCDGDRLFNTKLYSDLHLEQWESQLEQVHLGDCKLIASIWASTPSEMAYLAARVERMGAHGIEISISAPIGTRSPAFNYASDHIRAAIHAAARAVDIPVMVKLSYEAAASLPFLRAVQEAGAVAISAIDALRGIQGIDLERRRPRMPTYGGYSGPAIHPISLAVTAALMQYTTLPLCSVGGIQCGEQALEFLMLGAHAVQIGTVIQMEGYSAITRIVQETEHWMDAHGGLSPEALRGTALSALVPFEDMDSQLLTAHLDSPCRSHCGLCMAGCRYDAISRAEDQLRIDPGRCQGCGLCAARCPEHVISLSW